MADRQIPHDGYGTSLPPCSSLMRELTKCRASDCNALFPSNSDRLRHEQHCEIVAHQLSSMAYREAQYAVQPHRLDTQMASFSIETDSDESSSIVFTPDNSRAPSICDPQDRRQSGVIRIIRRHIGSCSSTPETDLRAGQTARPKRLKKQEKEKYNRNQLASVLWRMEDFFRNYLGWERREQSGGNGNGAGLNANKNTIMRGDEDLLYYFIHREYCWGVEAGDLEVRQQRMREILDGAMTNVPYTDTFMAPREEMLCAHEDSKSKECVVHGHPDWRECRRLRADPRFVARRNEFVAGLEGRRGVLGRGSSSRTVPFSSQRRGR